MSLSLSHMDSGSGEVVGNFASKDVIWTTKEYLTEHFARHTEAVHALDGMAKLAMSVFVVYAVRFYAPSFSQRYKMGPATLERALKFQDYDSKVAIATES